MNADSLQHTIHHPLEFALGPLTVTGFGFGVLMAFIIAQTVSQRELLRRGHFAEAQAIPDLLVAAIVGGLIGAKVYYVAIIARDAGELLSRFGFVFWGGLIGGALAVLFMIRRRRLPIPRIADVAGPAIAAAYAVGRTACWAVGDDYGSPWPGGGRLAVRFPEGAPPSTAAIMNSDFGVPIPAGTSPETVLAVHPTQLYEVAMGLAMFAVLWRLRDHRHSDGWLFGGYMIAAGLERFIVEFFRAKDDRFFGALSLAQLIAIGFVVGGAIVMTRTRHARTPSAASLRPSADSPRPSADSPPAPPSTSEPQHRRRNDG